MAQWLQDMSVGEWYDVAGEPFEIVGIDTKAELVLVQHFDSTLEEFDFDTWVELAAKPIPPPEDYSGALDMDKNDFGFDPEESLGRHGGNPLDALDQPGDELY